MPTREILYLLAIDARSGNAVKRLCRGWQSGLFHLDALDGLHDPAPTTTGSVLIAAETASQVLSLMGAGGFSPLPHPAIGIVRQATAPQAVALMRAGLWHLLVGPPELGPFARAVAEALAEDANRLARRQRLATVRSKLANLAPGERDVLRLLLLGRTNKAIARELQLGRRTVEARRARLLRKFETDNLAALIHAVAGVHRDNLLAEVTIDDDRVQAPRERGSAR